MKRIVHKFTNYKEAEAAEIEQYTHMSVDERQYIAAFLKRRVYGLKPCDVREYHMDVKK